MKKIFLFSLLLISVVFGAEKVEGSWRQISKYDASNDEVFGVHGQNHIVFGVDMGFGVEFGKHHLGPIIPTIVRVGYLRDIGKDWAVSANLLYNTNIIRPFHKLGVEVSGYYKSSSYVWFYLGAGILKDVQSNTILDSWYPVVKLGMLWNFNKYIGLTMDLINFTWDTQGGYFGLGVGFGLQFKI